LDGVRPAQDGGPNRRVLWGFPAAVALVFAVLVAFGINGSSEGALYTQIYGTPDPHVIAGEPQAIRSDEWNTFTVYTVSQAELGLARFNPTGIGPLDATLKPDVPALDWSLALRPQHWGFLFLPFANAFAWRWWFGGATLAVAIYILAVRLLPRRPLVGAGLAVGFFFAPFIQWWYVSELTASLTWAFAVMAVTVWLSEARTRWGKAALALVAAYATAWAALGLYPPFIVPCAWVVIGFAVGWLAQRRAGVGWRQRLALVGWLGAAAAGGLAAAAAFLVTRWGTMSAALSTSYPGERLIPPGGGLDLTWRAMPWTGLFSREMLTGETSLGGNNSESSTFVLFTLFLAPVAVWAVVRVWREHRRVEWTVIAPAAVIGLILAYMYVPGWGALAHLLLLDRSFFGRMLPGLGAGSVVLVLVLARSLAATRPRRAPWTMATGALVFYFTVTAWVMSYAAVHGLGVPFASVGTACLALGGLALVAFARGRATAGAAGFLVISLAVGWGVNPINLGFFDLRETATAERLEAFAEDHPGHWIVLGNRTFTPGLAIATGIGALGGYQFSPDHEAWAELDPTGVYEPVWNRLGVVYWMDSPEAERISTPQADLIDIAFDACADYEQTHAANVFSSIPLTSACLAEEETWSEGQHQFFIYTLTPPVGAAAEG
jgi:hypothetical protein